MLLLLAMIVAFQVYRLRKLSRLLQNKSIYTYVIHRLPFPMFLREIQTGMDGRSYLGRYLFYNKIGGQILGVNPYQMINNLGEQTAKRWTDSFDRLINGEEVKDENHTIYTKDGVSFEAQPLIRVLEIKGKRYLMGTFLNIFELQHHIREAKKADKEKATFLEQISYELRTPLNSILGFSLLLADEHESLSKDTQKEYAEIILRKSTHLNVLINDILMLANVDNKRMEPQIEDGDIIPQLHQLEYKFQKAIKPTKEIHFTFEFPYCFAMMRYDKNVYPYIIEQFISNAIKFTRAGTIRSGIYFEGDNEVMYCINEVDRTYSDSELIHMFKRFHKIDPFSPGPGLGLSICKAITMQKKGYIGVKQCRHKLLFWAQLPAMYDVEVEDEELLHDITELISSRWDGIWFAEDGIAQMGQPREDNVEKQNIV